MSFLDKPKILIFLAGFTTLNLIQLLVPVPINTHFGPQQFSEIFSQEAKRSFLDLPFP